jgi:hypothetical protein
MGAVESYREHRSKIFAPSASLSYPWLNRYTSRMDSVRFGKALGFGARSAAKALATAVDAATAPNPAGTRSAPQKNAQAAQPPRPSQQSAGSDATAASAHGSSAPRSSVSNPPLPPVLQSAARTAARATVQARQAGAQTRHATTAVARGSRRFGEAVWGPFVRLSGVLWLEITGSFFGLFALFVLQSVWQHRADLHQTPMNHTAHQHFLLYCAVALVFLYFTVESFIRAHRRSRKR